MKELIFDFVTKYAVWGILFFTGAAVFLLWRLLRQQKRLNKSLAMITGNIQAYFDVILAEEEPEPELAVYQERGREKAPGTYPERTREGVSGTYPERTREGAPGSGQERRRQEVFYTDGGTAAVRRERMREEEAQGLRDRGAASAAGNRPEGEEDVLNAVFQEFFS